MGSVVLLLLAGLAREVPEFMTFVCVCGTLSVWAAAVRVTTWTSWGHIDHGGDDDARWARIGWEMLGQPTGATPP
jgi:quinol-cytochrome oxidoreductase complex cytochrome b subunit